MKIEEIMSDEAILQEMGARVARCRLNQNRTQDALAEEAGVSRATVQRIEQGHSTQLTNLLRVLRALDLIGNLELLVPVPPESPVQAVRRKGRVRRRASVPRKQTRAATPWSWGEGE